MYNAIKLAEFGSMLSVTILVVIIWSIFWKGFALWYAAKANEKWWFVALLLISTAGILDIIYLFVFCKDPAFKNFFFSKLKSKSGTPAPEQETVVVPEKDTKAL